MPLFTRDHLFLRGRTAVLPYTSTQTGRSKVVPRTNLNRVQHGRRIEQQFNIAVDEFDAGREGDFVYLVFISPWDFLLDLDKLNKGDFQLATYKTVEFENANGAHKVYEATVRLRKRAISAFLRKVEGYIHRDTALRTRRDGTVGGGNPLNQSLVANIEEIRAATLQSFWQEPELAFPNPEEVIWWEVWIRREPNEEDANPIGSILPILEQAGVQIGRRFLKFPEHYVYLLHGSANQLSVSLLYTDRLSELRKPRETVDFFTYLERQDQNNWIQDLVNRTDNLAEENIIAVCLLDTGVNINNPLLSNLIPQRNIDVVNPGWNSADTVGHGTSMAGLALFGDLTDALATTERIRISHHIESIKLLNSNHPHEPQVYGAVTQEAVSRAVILNPQFKRIVCMAVTSEEFEHRGRPSSWSSAIDQILFGTIEQPNEDTLFFVSSGNVPPLDRVHYPLSNNEHSIQDPAQSFNAITVGAYTLKDSIDTLQFPGVQILANRGAMSPCNTTSVSWENSWCRKPDIVFEGGNQGRQQENTIDPESLQLLTTAKGGIGRSWLTSFNDTSASTALAARFAAILYNNYSRLRPETIRALIVHSADWTSAMLHGRQISDLPFNEKERLFCTVGYGVPNLERAMRSANNSLSLIVERTIKPYKLEESRVKTDQFHLLDLPWPVEALQDLMATTVKFKITLSYFIEPNPGNKEYKKSVSYSSYGLRFKMIDSLEGIDTFKKRISKAMREEDEVYETEGSEHWILGERIRNKGSIHKDIWTGTAADLATRNRIAIYPIGGWWKNRRRQGRYDHTVRYSVILTIETPQEDIDIFTPVLNQIQVDIPGI